MSASDAAIDFNRDIRPILSDKCIRCHGPDSGSRQAELRLDREHDAKADHSGHTPIVPGSPEESELYRRITCPDADERMPPEKSGKSLSAAEIELLRRWIAEGAQWMPAWAYVPPKKVAPQDLTNSIQASANAADQTAVRETADGTRGSWIDQLVQARLHSAGLQPSGPADKVTLIRRLSVDLIGLPPTPVEVDAFVNDERADAYERLVDRLLISPHFGERLAMYWLDLVRYADTVGYHGDQEQSISPYRDYVIDSFNRNLPFDQFTREQLAGDLLSQPTIEQKIATGYNRLLQTSHEGGIQKKEYLAIYAADRVRNFSNVWMGATMGCAQCHDHKYDPYTSKDFYSMQAFFADIDEDRHFRNGVNKNPTLREPEMELPTEAEKLEIAKLNERLSELQAALKQESTKQKAEVVRNDSDKMPPPDKSAVTNTTNGASQKDATGQREDSDPDSGNESKPQQSQAADEKPDAAADSKSDVAQIESTLRKLQREMAAVESQLKNAHAKVRRTMITVAKAPRPIRILPRGNWMDDSGEIVEPAIPEFMGKLAVDGRRATRLDLANWLVDSESGVGGLTARVMANRFWYLMFGRGIAPVLDDFGGQGQAPVNPELLDALALDFVESGWDMKHMLKLIAMSRTYRQASTETPQLHDRDPLNQFFARQNKFRFPAEVIRDSALATSGLLVDQLDGPSVKPYQPAGYYRHLNFPEREYESDADDRQWRRGVYMHWQRQFLHPMLKAFDAPSREECTAQRPRSNTPLAALVLLNDPTFVEAARGFAARIMRETVASGDKSSAASQRVDFAFRCATSRTATEEEQKLLQNLLERSRLYYADHRDEAGKLLAIGLKTVPNDLDRTELASWTIVARSIMSMNEALTRN